LAGDFKSDALIRPGDESDFVQWAFHAHLLPAAGAAWVADSK
jgi:hypothetical protein